jgi:hypothetical protein
MLEVEMREVGAEGRWAFERKCGAYRRRVVGGRFNVVNIA